MCVALYGLCVPGHCVPSRETSNRHTWIRTFCVGEDEDEGECLCVCVCVCVGVSVGVCMFVFSICMFYYSKWVCTKPIYTKMLQSKRPIPSGLQKWLIHGITDSRVFAVKRALLLFLVFCPLPLPKIKKFVGPVKAGRLLHTDIHTQRVSYIYRTFPLQGRGVQLINSHEWFQNMSLQESK